MYTYSFCDIWHALIFCTIQDAFHPAKWWWRMAFSSIVLDILGVCNENTIFVTPLFKKKKVLLPTTGVEEAFMECFKLWEIRYLFLKDIFEYILDVFSIWTKIFISI